MNKTTESRRIHHRSDLIRIAVNAMRERNLLPDFSATAQREVEALVGAAADPDPAIKDLRSLLWCSIDNDDSLDLDQLTCVDPLPDGYLRLYVAIADVDALVKKALRLMPTRRPIPPPCTPRRVFFRCCPSASRLA